jgi:broad specificity phosphatase PhoE
LIRASDTLEGRAELLGTKDLSCNVCGTSRLVQLHDTDRPEAGISHLIRSGEELFSSLGKQEPSIERHQVESLLQLSKKHHLNPYSYPLLALNRHAFTDSLELAASSITSGKQGSYTEARRLCKEIIAGLERIYAPGHPVLAVQHGILARLLLNNVNGEALTSIEDMRIAWEQCKVAREKMEIAFGKNKDKGVLVRGMERELELLERDMNWRGMAQARIAGR